MSCLPTHMLLTPGLTVTMLSAFPGYPLEAQNVCEKAQEQREVQSDDVMGHVE